MACSSSTVEKCATPAAPRRPLDASLGRGGAALDPHRNSLNLIRVLLAAAVLVSHSFALTGRPEPRWADETLGGWAVLGFFVVSGYLITGARFRTDGGRFLINRVARIFPGYVVCLVVVAFGFAPVAYVIQHHTIDGFLTTPTTPLNFVFENLFLHIADYTVAGTLSGIPYPAAWDGSVWSLWFEFFCYIIVGVAAIAPVVRRKPWPLVAMFAVSVLLHAKIATVVAYVGGNGDFVLLMKLLPYFLGGSVLFVVKERCPLRWWCALPALAAALATTAVLPGWGGQLAAPLYAYAILWTANVLPCPQFIRVHDVSYGVYIYAFPVTQLLILKGGHRYGVVVLDVAVVLVTLVLATGSWFLIERPSKNLVARGRAVHSPRAAAPELSARSPEASERDDEEPRPPAPGEADEDTAEIPALAPAAGRTPVVAPAMPTGRLLPLTASRREWAPTA